jgi:hypothetical protein
MTLLRLPCGGRPPVPAPARLIQAAWPPPPQGQGPHVPLAGAPYGRLGPSPACCQAEALVVVTAAACLANPCGNHLHDWGGRPLQGRRDQEPGLSGSRHRDDEDRHRDFRPADRPPTPPVLGPARAWPAIAPCPAGRPRGGPGPVGLRGSPPRTPRRPPTLLPRSRPPWVGPPRSPPPPGQALPPPSPRTGVQTGGDPRRHGGGAIQPAHARRARRRLRLPPQPHRPGRFRLHGLAGRQRVLPTIPPRRLGQRPPREAREHLSHDHPVLGADRLRPGGTPSPGCIQGAGAPALGPGAGPRGIIPRPRVSAAPPRRMCLRKQPPRLPFDGCPVPGAICGQGLQHPPARLQAKRRQEWRHGRLVPAPHHPCAPWPQTPPAWSGAHGGNRPSTRWPPLPSLGRVAHDAPPLLSGTPLWPSPPGGCRMGRVLATPNPRNYCLVGPSTRKPR